MKKEINILYTNGKGIYKIYWIKQSVQKDIYHGFHNKKFEGLHWSHHKDGNTFVRSTKSQPYKTHTGSPIAKIKDLYNLPTICVKGNNLSEQGFSKYGSKKLANPILVDTRLFPDDSTINIHLSLLPPDKIERLNSKWFHKKHKDDYKILQIVQDINPWLVIHIQGILN
ncbi:MAG: hypothetical protein ABII88_02680 [Candidatus Omnitrophota bacterium]